jgi:hypothetical protein
MDARPVKQQVVPRYPTRLEALADRDLLEKHMPVAWKSCVEMAGAVTMLLAANNCFAQQPDSKVKQLNKFVAPIFEHGKGRAVGGCTVVSPPIFLSEQDAMQVIREEMNKAGLTRYDNTNDPPSISVPKTIQKDGSKPILFEGSAKKKIGFSLVAAESYRTLGGEISGWSVQEYDFLDLAKKNQSEAAKNAGEIYLGTFYDPAAFDPAAQYEAVEAALVSDAQKIRDLTAKRRATSDPALRRGIERSLSSIIEQPQSRRLLRMQVRDFIDWLKGQGAI